ncbi:vegetative cell wall protein gp1-like [Durio zibethinus]|uniref:Vegetative cell wall protein gp1-like n=1 Tax=Durio zibethinus TaxID=66656 RepID=A0A6P5Z7Q1_DURZI|nr:vegetative cell wall protein gp1-like [Durio zibethinus]
MSTATNFMKLSLPFYSFKLSTAKFPISLRTSYSNNAAVVLIKILPRGLLVESKKHVDPPEVEFRSPLEVPSGPNYRPPSIPPEVPEIPRTPEVDPSDTPLEFTTTDPPPLGRPKLDPGPDFPMPPLEPPPTGPEAPVPPPGRPPPPEVDPPLPPDLFPPLSTPPDYVPPPSIPPNIPPPIVPPDIPPTKGPSFVF